MKGDIASFPKGKFEQVVKILREKGHSEKELLDLSRIESGALALNDFARANDPFTKVGKVQLAVEVSTVIRASPDSFRVAWIERRYENGQIAGTERWTAILTIAIQQPRDAERLRKNPLGVFVNAINWSKEMSQ